MKISHGARWLLAIAIAGRLLVTSPARAQAPTANPPNNPRQASPSAAETTPPAPGRNPGEDPAAASGDLQEPIFRAQIEEVTVPVTVTDSDGEFVLDLNPGDFRLLDNGEPQKIESFELSWEPVSMVIVAETSSRVEKQLADIERTGILFTQLIMGESGEAAVIAFDTEIRLVQGFTDNPDLIEKALKNLKPGGEDVRLSDALMRALYLLQSRPKERRKIIVAISEARDHGSANTPGFVLRGAQLLGISIYTIGLSTASGMLSRAEMQGPSSPFPPGVVARPTPSNTVPVPSTQAPVGAANLDMLPIIEELVSYTKQLLLNRNPLSFYAQGTGAMEFSGGSGDVEQALSRIGREVRSQYLLTYRPNNLRQPQFHHITVTVARPGLRVRTRPGYMYGGPADGSSPATTTQTAPPASAP
ncbi:MAG TPA: VWA domain-containing protein [Terriglobia bacterium]|nr:VWA domain-containing protein [Terriglobia bacterium]